MRKKWLKYLLRGGLALALPVVCYLTAALLGAVIPRNSDFVSAEDGVRIWVACNPIHSDVVVPAKNEFYDWTKLVERGHAKAVNESFDHLAIGWGNRKFYLETPTWGDLTLTNFTRAFFGLGDSAMHVVWLRGTPIVDQDCRTVQLTPDQYERLCRHISSSFETAADGKADHIEGSGYFGTDTFYEAEGRFSALSTCNAWTGRSLAAAGVKVGSWTPFKWGVLWHFDEPGVGHGEKD